MTATSSIVAISCIRPAERESNPRPWRLPAGGEQRNPVLHVGTTVGVIPFVDAGHVLLVRQIRHLARANSWELPGGGGQPGEDLAGDPLASDDDEVFERRVVPLREAVTMALDAGHGVGVQGRAARPALTRGHRPDFPWRGSDARLAPVSRLARLAALSLAAVLLAWAALPAQSQDKSRARPEPPPVDEKSAGIDGALRLSGLRNRLTGHRVRMKQILEDNNPALDPDVRQWLWQTLDVSFSPEAYTKPVKQALLDNHDADALTRVLIWYRSATGKKMVRLERSGVEPGHTQARRKYLATLEDKQPSEDRLVAVFRIDEASRASEGTFGAIKTVVNGWNRGIEQVVSEEGRQRAAQGEVARDVFRAQIRDMVGEDVLREMMYTYRDATDTELRAYAEFLESDAGKWFFNTAYKGQQAFLEKAVDKVAEEYVSTIYVKKATRPPSRTAADTAPKPAAPKAASAAPAKK